MEVYLPALFALEKSGHDFYNLLIFGTHLFGVWVLPEECRRIGFLGDDLRNTFRAQRSACSTVHTCSPASLLAFGNTSHFPSENPVVVSFCSITVCIALAGLFKPPDNFEFPTNQLFFLYGTSGEGRMVVHNKELEIGASFEDGDTKLNLDCNSDNVNVHVVALRKAPHMKAQSPDKFK